jgi:hypothetical protein
MQDAWEYHTTYTKFVMGHLDTHEIDTGLNHMGQEGWELFVIVPVMDGDKTVGLLHHFRRTAKSERKAGFAP